ncbi:hypothetical protein QVD17_40035 [Tagetes erecta]|uniref:Reverse transcriptase zinc-binding domain-containing protein n=1 Tax=Tagetes erecta TaxID=13708 RepID=A0AAD8JTG8_TARER|nr:hypothetical protein QVD17_40035 [Tagetes erecta]
MNLKDSVDKVYVDSAWTWPNELVDQFPSLSSISIPFRTDGEDKLCWREGSKLIPYSTSNAWEHIRHKVENVQWAECVWFPQCIPKHAFNMWLICQAAAADADLLKSSDDNADVNVGNPSLGDDVNNKMGDADAEKIKSYKDTIKQEKRVNFRKELEDTQSLIESNPYDGGLREKEAKYLKEFVEASMDEERFVKQKAKVKWLAEGDANTKYFHNILKCKNNKKTILSVLGVDGMVLEGDLMVHEFVNFYEHFLGGEHDSPTLPSMDLFSKRLDMEGGTGADAVQYFFSLECD